MKAPPALKHGYSFPRKNKRNPRVANLTAEQRKKRCSTPLFLKSLPLQRLPGAGRGPGALIHGPPLPTKAPPALKHGYSFPRKNKRNSRVANLTAEQRKKRCSTPLFLKSFPLQRLPGAGRAGVGLRERVRQDTLTLRMQPQRGMPGLSACEQRAKQRVEGVPLRAPTFGPAG